MSKRRTSKFHEGEYVALSHSTHGLHENMIVCVYNTPKNGREEIEVVINGTHMFIKTKYLNKVKSNRFSLKFNNGDQAIAKRHYERFIKGSIVVIISNYLGTNNKLVVKDERGITGGIPEPLLTRIA